MVPVYIMPAMITTTDSWLRRLQRAWREIESHEFWFLSGWGKGGCGDTDEGKRGRGLGEGWREGRYERGVVLRQFVPPLVHYK